MKTVRQTILSYPHKEIDGNHYYTLTDAVRAIYEYSEQFKYNINEADIDAWADGEFIKMRSLDPKVDIVKEYTKQGMIIGAKAVLNRKINHIPDEYGV